MVTACVEVSYLCKRKRFSVTKVAKVWLFAWRFITYLSCGFQACHKVARIPDGKNLITAAVNTMASSSSDTTSQSVQPSEYNWCRSQVSYNWCQNLIPPHLCGNILHSSAMSKDIVRAMTLSFVDCVIY